MCKLSRNFIAISIIHHPVLQVCSSVHEQQCAPSYSQQCAPAPATSRQQQHQQGQETVPGSIRDIQAVPRVVSVTSFRDPTQSSSRRGSSDLGSDENELKETFLATGVFQRKEGELLDGRRSFKGQRFRRQVHSELSNSNLRSSASSKTEQTLPGSIYDIPNVARVISRTTFTNGNSQPRNLAQSRSLVKKGLSEEELKDTFLTTGIFQRKEDVDKLASRRNVRLRRQAPRSSYYATSSVQSCQSMPSSQCISVPRQKCSTSMSPSCRPVPRRVCREVPRQVCMSVPRQVCSTVPTQSCSHVPRTQCKSVPRQKCRDVPQEVCKNVDREVCENVPNKNCKKVPQQKCSNKTKCTSVPKTKCSTKPIETCMKVPKQQCRNVQRNVCKTVPQKKCKNVCRTVYWCKVCSVSRPGYTKHHH